MTPVYCPNCSHALNEEVEFSGETGWCEHCQDVFTGPPRAIPIWVLGAILVMGQATALVSS